LASIVHEVEKGAPVELTRRGKPVAVIVSVNEFRRVSRAKTGFFDACQEFRRRMGLEKLGIGSDVFEGVRDRSVGRDVSL
jgi:prevent-host-death family protein